ncbi:DNA alkylation repair protein [Actinomyces faecalis]|uniref:DNA alkylation repair protein n=1 Tax=Actinomyces faecalis TaxID=2722820 RepID=UPI001551F817|nr:DNA alkylation repair protein [Actinomyces faecalis]
MLSVTHLADPDNATFVARLVPGIDPATIIGARVPALRAYAKESWRERPEEVLSFLTRLPHRLFDENMLHGLLLSQAKDPGQFLDGAEAFLPCVDNWAVCDSMSAKPLRRDLPTLEAAARRWIAAEHLYTRRFGIGVLMEFFLGDAFRPDLLELVVSVRSQEYYLEMMVAWYLATAVTRQPGTALPWLAQEELADRLSVSVRRKAIAKCLDATRIPPETKDLLRQVRAGLPRR